MAKRPAPKLHDFDKLLCQYVAQQFWSHMSEAFERDMPEKLSPLARPRPTVDAVRRYHADRLESFRERAKTLRDEWQHPRNRRRSGEGEHGRAPRAVRQPLFSTKLDAADRFALYFAGDLAGGFSHHTKDKKTGERVLVSGHEAYVADPSIRRQIHRLQLYVIRLGDEPTLLNDSELEMLQRAADGWESDSASMRRTWLPQVGLHKSYRSCLTEIVELLGKSTRDEFDKLSNEISSSLEGRNAAVSPQGNPMGYVTSLSEGVQNVRKWLESIRQILHDANRLDLVPHDPRLKSLSGQFPTPTTIEVAGFENLAPEVQEAVRRVKAAVARDRSLSEASVARICEKATGKTATITKAVKFLRDCGELKPTKRKERPKRG